MATASAGEEHGVHSDLTGLCERLPPPHGRRTPAAVPEGRGRRAAVLILLTLVAGDWDLLLIRRASRLPSHAGQMAFPGGAVEPDDNVREPGDMAKVALRESCEEVGLAPEEATVVSVQPAEPVSGGTFVVSPVIAWRAAPVRRLVPFGPEVAAIHREPVARLADPANRILVRHPSGNTGPGFVVDGQMVWGFTASLVDRVLRGGGWARPWKSAGVPVEVTRH